MRIAIDIEAACGDLDGTGVYISEMVSHLANIDQVNEYTLFASRTAQECPSPAVGGNNRFRRQTLPMSRKLCQAWWLVVNWPGVDHYIGKHDVYHSMTPNMFPATSGRYLVTVHDLSWVVRPELYNRRHCHVWAVHRWRMKRRADHFVAVSEWTKRDMMKYLNIAPDRITVIPEGVRSCFRPLEEKVVEEVKARYNVKEPYFLVVGDMNPRKNNQRVVEAFAKVRSRTSEAVRLLFVGTPGYRADRTLHQIAALDLKDAVALLGYVPDADLAALMNGACGLLFVSLHEGFGLPILEAMACGTAVVTSSVTSMPEVAGDAAILVDPSSEEEIAQAMWQVLTDPRTRAQLGALGLRRVQKFKWSDAAGETLKLYERLGG